MSVPAWLPPLIPFDAYGGRWDAYLAGLYDVFRRDFLGRRPDFRGKRLGLKRMPLTQGKEATFWHFIQEGPVEADRVPDLRRCERLGWIRPIIEHESDPQIRSWTHDIRGSIRTHLWLHEMEYLVVLDERPDFVLPWTAFPVTEPRRIAYFDEQYRRYKKLAPPLRAAP